MAVLLVVMNWFFHRVYWTGWISHHHRRRRALLGGSSGAALTAGLLALGFTGVYREGFEIVLFLQALRLKYGSAAVLEGVALGLAFTAAAGRTWFALFPTVETLAAHTLAACAVIGSYLVAEHVRVRRPTRRGLTPARRPERPPSAEPATT